MTWALATGSSYSIPCSARAVHGERRITALRAPRSAAPSRQRLGDPVDRAAADRLIAVEHEARPAGRPASRAAAASAFRRCRRRSGSSAASALRSPQPRISTSLAAALDDRAEPLDRGQRRAGVGGVQVVADPAPARTAIAPISAARWEIDLSAGDAERPAQRPGRVEARVHAPRHREPEPGHQLLGAPRLLLAGDPQRDHALAHVGRRIQRHVGDVDAGAARARARAAATTPGRFGTEARSSNSGPPASCASSSRRRSSAAPSFQSVMLAASAASSASRTRLQARDRVVDPGDQRVAVGQVDVGPDARSRRRPREWRRESSGRWRAGARPRRPASGAACATSTLASTCGRCDTVARIVSWISGSIATGRAPRLCSEAVQALVEDPRGASGSASDTRSRPRTGRHGRARPRLVSAPASGCPPTKRGSSSAATTARLVEPTSLTTQSGRRRVPAPAVTAARSPPTGTATNTASASRDRLADVVAGVGRSRPRSSATSSASARRVVAGDGGAEPLARGEPDRAADQPDADERATFIRPRHASERLPRDRGRRPARARRTRRSRRPPAAAARRRSPRRGAGGPRR